MTGKQSCSRCGAELPGGKWDSFCPRCLARVALVRACPRNSDKFAHPGNGSDQAGESPLRLFGDYELIEEIARGGMAVVWRARQRSVGRAVALKLLRTAEFARPEAAERFRAEASAVASMQHPHIVAVHDFGEHQGQPWISMDFIEGRTLAELVREKPLQPKHAAELLKTIAETIAYAHSRGILHRDIKPSNILLDQNGAPRITDFGLAKRFAPSEAETPNSDLTLSGQLVGTPNYAPPEQLAVRHGTLGPQSDVYALGAVLYEMLTGRPPFLAATIEATLLQVIDAEPVAPRSLNAAVPLDLETICLKCLEKEPIRRYGAAQELADELRRFLRDEPVLARPLGMPGRFRRWCRRKPALATLVLSLFSALVVGATLTFWQWRRAETHAQELSATVTRLRLDQAEDRLGGGETSEGLAMLARLLRADPDNRAAAQRVVAVLNQRNFLRPLPGLVANRHFAWTSAFAQHEHFLMTSTNDGRTLTLWDTRNGFDLNKSIEVGETVRLTTFSQDGRFSLVGTQSKSLRLYDLSDGSLQAGPHPTPGFPEQLVLSPDVRLAVVVSVPDFAGDNWRRTQGSVVRLTDGEQMHKAVSFHWAEFSSDGTRLVTVDDQVATLRDPATWRPIGQPLRDSSRINSAVFSPDSRRVLTAGAGSNATIWNAEDGTLFIRLAHGVSVLSAFFSPDGKRAFTYDIAGNGRLWDASTAKLLGGPFPQNKGHGATSFSPDGQLFLSYDAGRLVLRSGINGVALGEPFATDDTPTRARFLRDSQRFVTTSFGGSTRLWDATLRAAAPMVFQDSLELNYARLSPDQSSVATANKGSRARIWNSRTGKAVGKALAHGSGVVSVEWNPNGKTLVTASTDHTARLWEARSGEPLGTVMQHAGPVTHTEFSPDGQWIATASHDGSARIWNASNGLPVSPPLGHTGFVARARFSPDSRLLATASRDQTVRIWSVPSGAPMGKPLTDENYFSDAVFSPDGRTIVTHGERAFAALWDSETRRERTRALKHTAGLSSAEFSSDSRRVVTASADRTARLWDAATGHPLVRPLQHRDGVQWAGFSPDDRFVLTVSQDSTARLWDAATGHAVSDAFRHGQRIITGQWSADGASFLTASYDRTAKLWPVWLIPNAGAPSWLADLAEISGGLRQQNDETFQSIGLREIVAAHQRTKSLPRFGSWGQWLEAFYAGKADSVSLPRSTTPP